MSRYGNEVVILGKTYDFVTKETIEFLKERYFQYNLSFQGWQEFFDEYHCWHLKLLNVPQEFIHPQTIDDLNVAIHIEEAIWVLRELQTMGNFYLQPYETGRGMHYFFHSPELEEDGCGYCISHYSSNNKALIFLESRSLESIGKKTTYQIQPLSKLVSDLWI